MDRNWIAVNQKGRSSFRHNGKKDFASELLSETWPVFKTAGGYSRGEQVPGDELALPLPTSVCNNATFQK